jgi:prephenate dehydratase
MAAQSNFLSGATTVTDEIRPVEYYSITVANKPGEAAKVLDVFRQAGVNLLGFWGYPAGRRSAVLDIVPEKAADFAAAARKAKIKAGPRKQGYFISGEDRVGAVAEVLDELGSAGANVYACQALCAGAGRYGFFLEFEGPDLRKARKILTARATAPAVAPAEPATPAQAEPAAPAPAEAAH